MQIKLMRLKLYKRLMRSGIQSFEWTPTKQLMLIIGSNGSGKAQPYDALVKIPDGWKRMGDVQVNDMVIARDGTPTKVLGVYPQGKQTIYKFTFGDGRTTRATGDHLWKVYHGGSIYPIQPRILNTLEIIEHLKGSRGHLLWVDLAESEQNADKMFPIDPYTLGVIIGDGCLTSGVVLSKPDEFIFDKIKTRLPVGLELVKRKVDKCLTYAIKASEQTSVRGYNNQKVNQLTLDLRACGLDNKKSHEKFIPEMYLHGSTKQRLELVQGLMDTDGYIDKSSTCSYSTTSPILAKQVEYLIRSIGGIANTSERITQFTTTMGAKKDGKISYTVNIRYKRPSELFSLPRKKSRANDNGQYANSLKLKIASVDVDGFEEAQCIAVDHPEHLYITDNFVVTHNTSIMDELSALPARHKAFIKGGEKEFHCYHNGNFYILKSVYDHGTGRHSFIRNDEELNSGGTFKIQEDLCFQEFGLTREIHDIMTGRTLFTDLSTAERRKLLTKMSVVNLDYAFDIFQKLKIESRSQKGTVDTITRRLVNENHDIPSDAEMQLMRESNQKLNERLNQLFTARQPNVKQGFNNEEEASTALAKLVERAKALLYSYPKVAKGFNANSREAFAAEKQLVAGQCSAIQAVIQRMAEELESLRGSSTADFEVSPDQLSNLESEITTLESTIATGGAELNRVITQLPIVNLDLTNDPLRRLEGMFSRWMASINAFPENTEGYIARSTYDKVIQNIQSNLAKRRQMDAAYQTASQRLSRLKGCDSVVCIKCEHEFKPGVDETEGPRLEEYINQLTVKMDEIDLAVKQDEEYVELYKDYRGHVSNFASIQSEYSDFALLWDHLAKSQIMFRTPKALLVDAIAWHEAMKKFISIRVDSARLESLQSRLRTLKEIDSDAVAYTRKRTMELEHAISDKYREQTEANQFFRDIEQGERDIESMNREINDILERYVEWRRRAMSHVEWLLDKAYESEITETQLQLAEGTRRLNISEQRENSIRVLENEVNSAREVASDLNLLIKALSPNGGLLGKYLMGFMQGVVSYVNAFIGEVWTYPMEVLPSKVEKDELDYNFPLNVSNGAVIADDISLGSDSQLEIVNFSFEQAVRKFLGMEDYPLFLDEFGRTFDEQHRANLIPFISRLIENGHYKQIFFISHFQSEHGAFNSAEYIVLDPTNITVPVQFNKNLVLG